MNTTTTPPCVNCGAPPAGLYCQACGQKIGAKRFTLMALLKDIPHAVFHVDRGFFATLRKLAVHPGLAIRGYLDGQRVRHFNPITLLALTAGLSALLFSAFPFAYMALDARLPADIAQKYSEFARLNFKYYSFTLLFYLPALALITQLCFAGLDATRSRSYGEHLVINSFILAFVSFTMVMLFPAFVASNDTPAFPSVWSAASIFFLAYHVVALYATFVVPGKVISTAVRSAVAVLLYLVMLLVVSQSFFWLVYLKL